MEDIRALQLYPFSDCGLAALYLRRSDESQFAAIGRPNTRDGDISLAGHAIDFSCSKLRAKRVVRLQGGKFLWGILLILASSYNPCWWQFFAA